MKYPSLVIAYKSELLESNWINGLFNNIGFAVYKYYVVKEGRTVKHTKHLNRRSIGNWLANKDF